MVGNPYLIALRQSCPLTDKNQARCVVLSATPVENGHTVPAVETLEKFARALEVPMYVLFYDGDEPNSR